jgi:hypothetical protein
MAIAFHTNLCVPGKGQLTHPGSVPQIMGILRQYLQITDTIVTGTGLKDIPECEAAKVV